MLLENEWWCSFTFTFNLSVNQTFLSHHCHILFKISGVFSPLLHPLSLLLFLFPPSLLPSLSQWIPQQTLGRDRFHRQDNWAPPVAPVKPQSYWLGPNGRISFSLHVAPQHVSRSGKKWDCWAQRGPVLWGWSHHYAPSSLGPCFSPRSEEGWGAVGGSRRSHLTIFWCLRISRKAPVAHACVCGLTTK